MKQRKGSAELEGESGTFGDVLGGTRPASTAPAINWGASRQGSTARRSRPRAGATKLRAVADAPEAGDDLSRRYDRETVDRLYDALDGVLPTLHSNDQSIYMHLFRRTVGAGKTTCVISLAELGRLAGVGVSGATYSVRRLENGEPRRIKRTGKRLGKGKEQGVEIEVFLP
jgi:hypothetical protein